jgi:hypothetical protein
MGDREPKNNWNWRNDRAPAKSSADVTSDVLMRGVSEAYKAEDRKNKDMQLGSENQDSNPGSLNANTSGGSSRE